MTSSSNPDSLYEIMGRRWLGIGNISSRHWFCGLEPGGTERPEWPTTWMDRYGGAEVIDGRLEAGDPDHDRWFSENAKAQPTWLPLIRTLLAFEDKPSDEASCLAYQRERFAAGDGNEAILELSAYAAKNIAVDSPRERYIKVRTDRIRNLLHEHEPSFLVCYGTTRRAEFERIVGGSFDADGFRMERKTICALVPHPTPRYRPAAPPSFWIDLGHELRRRSTSISVSS